MNMFMVIDPEKNMEHFKSDFSSQNCLFKKMRKKIYNNDFFE